MGIFSILLSHLYRGRVFPNNGNGNFTGLAPEKLMIGERIFEGINHPLIDDQMIENGCIEIYPMPIRRSLLLGDNPLNGWQASFYKSSIFIEKQYIQNCQIS